MCENRWVSVTQMAQNVRCELAMGGEGERGRRRNAAGHSLTANKKRNDL